MEQGLIAHRANGSDCYALDEDRLVISIRTGYDVDRVEIEYGDPFQSGIMGGNEKWSGMRQDITDCVRLSSQKLWSIVVEPRFHRCKYFFVLHDKEEVLYYFEDGCFCEEQLNIPGRVEQCFFFPWMNPSDINRVPEWVEDTIWYQIFPERFCNGNPELSPEGVKPWKCRRVGLMDFYGGDLQGIIDKLSYLEELGINGIYLNPVFASDTNHKYNTTDYTRIDPHFGSEETMIELVQKAHEKGIRIMVDAVFNHSGTKFAPWMDVVEKGPESEYFDWFFVHQWPIPIRGRDTRDGRFDSFAFTTMMPKINTNHPEVVDYFRKLCVHWVDDWGIDGIRFDVGNEVSHSFLRTLRSELKARRSQIYLMGEIWHDSLSWLMGDEYDAVMNYPFSQSIHNFFADESLSARDLEYSINRCYHMYMKQTNRVLFNLLDSHDTIRLYTRLGGNIEKFYQHMVLLFTMQGSPCIYYGTELAMPGGFDPDCRRCMPWKEIEAGKYDLPIQRMKQLIAMRKENPGCRAEAIHWIEEKEARLIHYIKTDGRQQIEVYLNASGEAQRIPIVGNALFSVGCKVDEAAEQGMIGVNGSIVLCR
ncbi:MAG: glycoside hydrolase family 13 protein [Lachnospiraceae bacterium]|nr:glycoside hydrolase family 13 protein [Lachnospiraceae bacterium]